MTIDEALTEYLIRWGAGALYDKNTPFGRDELNFIRDFVNKAPWFDEYARKYQLTSWGGWTLLRSHHEFLLQQAKGGQNEEEE